MPETIMFNLEKAIAAWRRQLTTAGIKSPRSLDELESHLREEIANQTRAGTTVGKAFETAVARVGEANALKAEFAKAERGRGPLELLMIAVCMIFVSFILFLGGAALWMCYSTTGDRIAGATAMICILITACFWSRAVPYLPVIQNERKRIAAALGSVIGGTIVATIYAQTMLHFLNPVDALLPSSVVWAILPVAVGVGLGIGLAQAGQKKNPQPA